MVGQGWVGFGRLYSACMKSVRRPNQLSRYCRTCKNNFTHFTLSTRTASSELLELPLSTVARRTGYPIVSYQSKITSPYSYLSHPQVFQSADLLWCGCDSRRILRGALLRTSIPSSMISFLLFLGGCRLTPPYRHRQGLALNHPQHIISRARYSTK